MPNNATAWFWLAAVAAAMYLIGRAAVKQPVVLGEFSYNDAIYNPNGGPGVLYNYRSELNGGYSGGLGNLADGNPYSIGL